MTQQSPRQSPIIVTSSWGGRITRTCSSSSRFPGGDLALPTTSSSTLKACAAWEPEAPRSARQPTIRRLRRIWQRSRGSSDRILNVLFVDWIVYEHQSMVGRNHLRSRGVRGICQPTGAPPRTARCPARALEASCAANLPAPVLLWENGTPVPRENPMKTSRRSIRFCRRKREPPVAASLSHRVERSRTARWIKKA